ncbi:hypothetical protein [Sphingomonas sp.]|uniref:hypothetical protein n=1 Tax=Sphingomonas sp. TaxID=28214 RepID=UPI0031D83B85
MFDPSRRLRILPIRPRTIFLSVAALVASPAIASQAGGDGGGDCFAMAAPMADAIPCIDPGHGKNADRPRQEPDKSKRGSEKKRMQVDRPVPEATSVPLSKS